MPEETPRQVPDLGPRSVGRILDRAFTLYRANFRTIAGSAMMAVFPIALAAGIAQTFYTREAMVLFRDIFTQTAAEPDFAALAQAQIWGWVSNLVALPFWAARLYLEACLYAAAIPMLYGERFTIREFLRGGRDGIDGGLVRDQVRAAVYDLPALAGEIDVAVAAQGGVAAPLVAGKGDKGSWFVEGFRDTIYPIPKLVRDLKVVALVRRDI